VERTAEDRRIRTVALTASGRELITPIFRTHAADIRRVFAEIPSSQLEQFERTLKKVGRHAEELGGTEKQKR